MSCYTKSQLEKSVLVLHVSFLLFFLLAISTVYAQKSYQLEDCTRSNDIAVQANCYEYVAINRGDISVCYKISDQDYSNSCITHFATSKKDIQKCGLIQKDFVR